MPFTFLCLIWDDTPGMCSENHKQVDPNYPEKVYIIRIKGRSTSVIGSNRYGKTHKPNNMLNNDFNKCWWLFKCQI